MQSAVVFGAAADAEAPSDDLVARQGSAPEMPAMTRATLVFYAPPPERGGAQADPLQSPASSVSAVDGEDQIFPHHHDHDDDNRMSSAKRWLVRAFRYGWGAVLGGSIFLVFAGQGVMFPRDSAGGWKPFPQCALVSMQARVNARILSPHYEIWRLVTALGLHRSTTHIFWDVSFGIFTVSLLEYVSPMFWGYNMVFAFLGWGICGNLGSALIAPRIVGCGSTPGFMGAAGASLVYIACSPNAPTTILVVGACGVVGLIFLAEAMETAGGTEPDFAGHVGGLLAGAFSALIACRLGHRGGWRLAGCALGTIAVSLLAILISTRSVRTASLDLQDAELRECLGITDDDKFSNP